jgi:ribosomal protein S18 acetylase RimI-like enzyme
VVSAYEYENNMHDVVLRAIDHNDYDALRYFFERNNVDAVTRHFHPFPLSAETAAAICLREHEDAYFAAWDGEKIVGFYMLRGWEEGYSIPSFGVLVDTEMHGRGIGRYLTDAAIGLARARGSPAIRLTVHEAAAVAVALYKAFGFVETNRVTHAGDVVLVMHKELTASSH